MVYGQISYAQTIQEIIQDANAQQEQLLRQQEKHREDYRSQQIPDVELEQESVRTSVDLTQIPIESPCFTPQEINFESSDLKSFSWIKRYLRPFKNKCLGQQGLSNLVEFLNQKIIDRGFITSRVGLFDQNFSQESLTLRIIPGRIRNIRVEPEDARINWRIAFPFKSGDVLNVRDLEQGLEQIKRVPSQDIDIKILPGDKPGESDILLTVSTTQRYRVGLTLDDSGNKSTGRLQISSNLSLDNLLNINDILTLSMNHDAEDQEFKGGTKGCGLMYTFPWDKWNFEFNLSSYEYYQTTSGRVQDFTFSGDNLQSRFKFQRLMRRNRTQKAHFGVALKRGRQRSFFDNIELAVQEKNTTSIEVFLKHQHNIGAARVNLELAHRQGVGWFGAKRYLAELEENGPTSHYNIETLDIRFNSPLLSKKFKFDFSSVFKAQVTEDELISNDHFWIGSRYSVRGFSGDKTLSAENGWLVRNELSLSFFERKLQPYLGYDIGRVSGPSSKELIGQTLSGSIIGFRSQWKQWYLDTFMSWPLSQPDGFENSEPTVGFSLNWQWN